MRKYMLFYCCALALANCHEPREVKETSPTMFRKDVGAQISLEMAERWRNRFMNKNRSGRTMNFQPIHAADLQAFLYPIDENVGVVLYRAIDDLGVHHILMRPYVDNGESIMTSEILDVNTGEVISGAVAQTWTENYKEADHEGPWSHFFGIDVFKNILAKPEFGYLKLEEAENDIGERQLLLYAYYNPESSGSRLQGDYSEYVEAYDASWACPNMCPN